MTAFLLGVAAGMVATALVIGLCLAAGDDPLDALTPGLWVVEVDNTGDIAAAEPLDDRRRP